MRNTEVKILCFVCVFFTFVLHFCAHFEFQNVVFNIITLCGCHDQKLCLIHATKIFSKKNLASCTIKGEFEGQCRSGRSKLDRISNPFLEEGAREFESSPLHPHNISPTRKKYHKRILNFLCFFKVFCIPLTPTKILDLALL